MAKICEQEKLEKKVKTMETRHSASTIMKNAGVSPRYIKESLGHTVCEQLKIIWRGLKMNNEKNFQNF
jgi:site-specific recombinase XerD